MTMAERMEWNSNVYSRLVNDRRSPVNSLSAEIDIHHKAFLTSEGTPKEESLILLRVHAIDFLCEVPHSLKFKFRETDALLSASVKDLPGFDPRKTSAAFEDLAKYAHNLLEQPWRKDFHRIRISSGFWIHNIRAHLYEAERMLSLIGYVADNADSLVLVRPPNTTVLIDFSRDCFIASQECLIQSQIWESLRKEEPENTLTLNDIFETRKLLVGDMRSAVSYLKKEVRRRQQEVEEALAHLRESGLAPDEFQAGPSPSPSRTAFVPVGTLIDIAETEATRIAKHQETSSPSQSQSQKFEGSGSMNTSTSNTSNSMAVSSPSLINSLETSSERLSELLQEQEVCLASLRANQGPMKSETSSPSSGGGPSGGRVLEGSYFYNFNSGDNGKPLTMTKIPKDFDDQSSKQRGILDRVWSNVPSLSTSLKKMEQFLAPDNKSTATSSTFYANNNDSYGGAGWDCPHCTFVNLNKRPVCSMCSKSRDFVLPKPS